MSRRGSISAQPLSEAQTRAAEERGVRASFMQGVVTTEAPAEIAGLVDEGRLRTRVGEVLLLAETRRAHEARNGAGRPRGKVVLGVDGRADAR